MPIGWLADWINLRLLLLAYAARRNYSAIFDRLGNRSSGGAGVFMALQGGVAFGFYNVGITMLSQRFQAGKLAAAK